MADRQVQYDKFRIGLYSPDGAFLADARMNDSHMFYCSGLVPGQTYNIVFTYDNALLLCLSFTCMTRGRVVSISPAHLLFNAGLATPRPGFLKMVSGLSPGGDEMEIVGLGFEKRIIQLLMKSGNNSVAEYFSKYGLYLFRAGEEPHNRFKQL